MEQGLDVVLVVLDLVKRHPDVGVFIGRVLQLEDHQGQAIEEHHDVRAAVVLGALDCELVDDQPVVVGLAVKVHHFDDGGLLLPPSGEHDAHAIEQQPVKAHVGLHQVGVLEGRQDSHGLLERNGRHPGVDALERCQQAFFQHHLAVVVPFGVLNLAGDVRTVGVPVPQFFEPTYCSLFDRALGDFCHAYCSLIERGLPWP